MYGRYKREELGGDTKLKPLRIYEEWIEIEKLKKVGVPQQRVYRKRDVEEEEAIKKAIEKDYIGFFEVSPVILCKSNESGNIYLADGWIRMKTAILNNIPKVKVKIKEYETDVEAYKDALVTSYNVNSSRGRVSGYSLLNMVKFLREELKMSVKEIAEELNKSEKHIYNLLAILEHEDLVEKVKNEEISLKEAIKLAYKHEPSLTVRLEGEEGEKPQIEAISEKEAQTGLAKTCEAVSEEISQKEAKIKEIGKKETESKVYKHLEIPSSIKSEMEKALE
ncbi:MAG: ArsR family transcriptional regulator, partial [Nitrososphaerota archaeon]